MIPIGTAVIVHNFGSHTGMVEEHEPTITRQGRARVAIGWIKVRLANGREWNGNPKLCAVRA